MVVKKDNFVNCVECTISIVGIRRTCGIDASKTTVWRMLDKCSNNVRSRMKKCPQLTQEYKAERLHWARIPMRCDWEKIQLLRVIFSDEKKFNLDVPDGCHSYWRDLCKEPWHFSTRNFGGGSLMCNGTSRLGVRLDEDEQRGVSECLRISSSLVSPAMCRTKTGLEDNDVPTMDRPSRSRDMNPMENLWVILRCRIHADKRQF
uniref:DDE_3 domain-containing protein n=1 Tax=Heterorhabditis bacteriophora TaxID=37862 RepID=A0A1I7XCA0_HETBA